MMKFPAVIYFKGTAAKAHPFHDLKAGILTRPKFSQTGPTSARVTGWLRSNKGPMVEVEIMLTTLSHYFEFVYEEEIDVVG
jgi:hypothetical protein